MNLIMRFAKGGESSCEAVDVVIWDRSCLKLDVAKEYSIFSGAAMGRAPAAAGPAGRHLRQLQKESKIVAQALLFCLSWK